MKDENDYVYLVRSSSPSSWLVSKWIDGDLEPTTVYTVERKKKLMCNCPSGKYRGYCKHTDMVSKHLKEETEGYREYNTSYKRVL